LNYFPFHIGDYAVHTRHLSLMEDLAYRRCLDLYYTRESALPADPAQVARLIGMREHVADVEAVLKEFFVPEEHGDWIHARCEAEIQKAHTAAERARTNGKAGGRPPRTQQQPTANPEETQPVSSGNPDESKSKAPITQDQDQYQEPKEEKGSRKRSAPPDKPEDVDAQVWEDWQRLRRDKKAAVTSTVVAEARREADKAGLPLERFLTIWCLRGSQGLQADWLKPEELKAHGAKTFRERDSELAAAKAHAWSGGLLGKSDHDTIDMEPIHGLISNR
jgi:uncharacterized protein YdaU (DUF1376 family)